MVGVLRQEKFEWGKSQCLMDAVIICMVFFARWIIAFGGVGNSRGFMTVIMIIH